MALRFSVIIPTLNRWRMLRSALASVRAQSWPSSEIIVVDGGSTDQTVEELKKQTDVRLISGPDRGVYDALNKGIAAARGDVIGLLNSDDCYEPGTFAAVAGAYTDAAQAVCGTAVVMEGDRVITAFDRAADKLVTSPRTALIGSCTINARFFQRTAMQTIGPFHLAYKYVSDRDWLVRWHEARLRTVPISKVVYRYLQHPGSLTFDADRLRELEIREELVRLARAWRKANATSETKRIAGALEGRCVAYLAIASARGKRFADASRWLRGDDGRPSAAPILAVLQSAPDWVMETLRRRNPPRSKLPASALEAGLETADQTSRRRLTEAHEHPAGTTLRR